MSTSEFLHLKIIFCILPIRNAYILKQLSKTFQKPTFSSHLGSWAQDYVCVFSFFSFFSVSVVWCKGELRNWVPAASGNERERLQILCGWDTTAWHWGGSWGAEHHTPEFWGWWCHQFPVIYNCSPRGLATAAQEDCSREVYWTRRACAQG